MLALVLVVLNGLFVAAEFAFVKVRRARLELLAAEGNTRAGVALFGVRHLDAYLSVCQLGITLASLALGWIGEPAFATVLRPFLAVLGFDNAALTTSLSIALGFSIVTFLHVIFGELAPKSISIQRAEQTVLVLAWPLRIFYVLCFPLVSVMNGISNAFLRLIGFAPASEGEQPHSAEELRLLVAASRKEGQLEDLEGKMLNNIFSFYKKTAKDIMVHRMDVQALELSSDIEEAKRLAKESGHTRFPLYFNNRDEIVGFLNIKDILRHSGAKSLKSLLRVPIYVNETTHLDKLLQFMQSKRQQFCVVVDEYGAWQGVISMEDILESIVGDIQDEFDNEEPDFIPQPDGSVLVSGDLALEDLAEQMELELGEDVEEGEYKKIAEYFLEELERIPAEGDSIQLCGRLFSVAHMEGKRIRRVRIHVPTGREQADGA